MRSLWNGRAVSAVALVVAVLPDEEEAIASWEIKKHGTRKGIVEVTET
jgi:hypothetical protein